MIKKLTLWSILAFGSYASTVSGAAADQARYEKIQEEMKVISALMKSSVKKDEGCEKCAISIRSHYLARQGAVFYVRSSGSQRFVTYSGSGGFEHIDMPDLPELSSLSSLSSLSDPAIAPHVESIEGNVTDIMIEVDEALSEAGIDIDIEDIGDSSDSSWSWSWSDDSDHDMHMLSGQHEEIRDLRREKDRLRREASRLKRDMRSAEKEELKRLQQEQESLQEEFEKTNAQYKALAEQRKKKVLAIKVKRAESRRERSEKIRQKNESIKTRVLHTLCEYQATLKNLPQKEHVSLFFESMADKNRSNVFVFDKSSLDQCTPEKGKVAEKALRYLL